MYHKKIIFKKKKQKNYILNKTKVFFLVIYTKEFGVITEKKYIHVCLQTCINVTYINFETFKEYFRVLQLAQTDGRIDRQFECIKIFNFVGKC